jgi:sugar lactone lactonase YvrE
MKVKIILIKIAVVFIGLSFNAQIINTFAGNGTIGYSGDGAAATLAQFFDPWAVAVDAAGNVYISDGGNNCIRKVNIAGIISTIAGTGAGGYSGDGGPATLAQLNGPVGIAVDAAGNIYIAEAINRRIRKVNSSGVISTFAGTGGLGYSGDGASATLAQFNNPTGVAVDAVGNVYINDQGNNCIRKVNTGGIISTIAGTGFGGFSGDGGAATLAMLWTPTGIATDAVGNLYIADGVNNQRIRKVNTSGIITTIAGTGVQGYSGDGAAATLAQLNNPTGVAVDTGGNVYIADFDNNRIRKIDTGGIISTIAGTGVQGYSGDGANAMLAQLNRPYGVAVDATGNVYIADYYNQRIRKINAPTGVNELSLKIEAIIYPNPNCGIFKLQIENEIENGEIILINSLGQKVYYQTVRQGINSITTSGLSKGLYNYILLTDKQKIKDGKIVMD